MMSVFRRYQVLVIIGLLVLFTVSASATDTNVLNLVTYDSDTGSLSWSLGGLLKLLIGGVAAAIAAGSIVFIIKTGFGFAKRFMSVGGGVYPRYTESFYMSEKDNDYLEARSRGYSPKQAYRFQQSNARSRANYGESSDSFDSYKKGVFHPSGMNRDN